MSNGAFNYKQLQQHRAVLTALVLGLVVVFLAVFIELTLSQRTSQVDPVLRQMAEPLNPTLKYEVLDELENFDYRSVDEMREIIRGMPIRIFDEKTLEVINASPVAATAEDQDQNSTTDQNADDLQTNPPATTSAQVEPSVPTTSDNAEQTEQNETTPLENETTEPGES